jgi:hypothetical protein
MACDGLDFGKKAPCFWLEYWRVIFSASECLDCIERGEQVHRHEFGLIFAVLAKDVPTLIAIDSLKVRIDHFSQQFLVRVCVLSFCPSSPDPRNHFLSSFVAIFAVQKGMAQNMPPRCHTEAEF